jgi:hypothetical protein
MDTGHGFFDGHRIPNDDLSRSQRLSTGPETVIVLYDGETEADGVQIGMQGSENMGYIAFHLGLWPHCDLEC